MDILTSHEIVNHPYDLHFVVSKMEQAGPNGSWSVRVSRGFGHNFKPLLSTDEPEQLRPTKENALWLVEVGVLYMALAGHFLSLMPRL